MLLQIITPFTIYFNARFVYQKWELWRLLTNFMFFGSLGGVLCPDSALPTLLHTLTASRNMYPDALYTRAALLLPGSCLGNKCAP